MKLNGKKQIYQNRFYFNKIAFVIGNTSIYINFFQTQQTTCILFHVWFEFAIKIHSELIYFIFCGNVALQQCFPHVPRIRTLNPWKRFWLYWTFWCNIRIRSFMASLSLLATMEHLSTGGIRIFCFRGSIRTIIIIKFVPWKQPQCSCADLGVIFS